MTIPTKEALTRGERIAYYNYTAMWTEEELAAEIDKAIAEETRKLRRSLQEIKEQHPLDGETLFMIIDKALAEPDDNKRHSKHASSEWLGFEESEKFIKGILEKPNEGESEGRG